MGRRTRVKVECFVNTNSDREIIIMADNEVMDSRA